MWEWKVFIEQLLLVTLSRQKRLQFLFVRFRFRFRFRIPDSGFLLFHTPFLILSASGMNSTNLERCTWLFICGTNWLFCGTNWLFYGTIWLLIGTIWLGTMSTIWPWNEMTGYRHAPSRLPMNKIKSLLQKIRKVTLFVWKSIRKNTPLSSEIHCYVQSTKGLHLNRYRSNCNSVGFYLRGTSKTSS